MNDKQRTIAVNALASGFPTSAAAKLSGLPKTSVAALKANITRGAIKVDQTPTPINVQAAGHATKTLAQELQYGPVDAQVWV